jgi:hypothetical protein
VIRTFLDTPPIPCVAPDGVFGAYGWCASDVLEWRRPGTSFDERAPLADADGSTWLGRMVFVFRGPCDFLPQELARLHAFGYGLEDERALAPHAIDDATDELHARNLRPHQLLWLAADGVNALFWGLHDWAHFHNHGPFVERAWTELQCDAAALAWMQRNRAAIGVSAERIARLVDEVFALSRARFADEALAFDGAPLEALRRFAET